MKSTSFESRRGLHPALGLHDHLGGVCDLNRDPGTPMRSSVPGRARDKLVHRASDVGRDAPGAQRIFLVRIHRPLTGCGNLLVAQRGVRGELGRRMGEAAVMLCWAAVFLLIALLAAALGFGFVATGAAVVAKVLCFVFLGLFLISLATGLARAQGPVGRA